MSGMRDVIAALSDEGVSLLHRLSKEQGSRAIHLAGELVMVAMLVGQEAPDVVGYGMVEAPPVTAFRDRLAAANAATDPAVLEAAAHVAVAMLAVADQRRAARA